LYIRMDSKRLYNRCRCRSYFKNPLDYTIPVVPVLKNPLDYIIPVVPSFF
jgi:hypothetical protein